MLERNQTSQRIGEAVRKDLHYSGIKHFVCLGSPERCLEELNIECLGETFYDEGAEGNFCFDCGFYDGEK